MNSGTQLLKMHGISTVIQFSPYLNHIMKEVQDNLQREGFLDDVPDEDLLTFEQCLQQENRYDEKIDLSNLMIQDTEGVSRFGDKFFDMILCGIEAAKEEAEY
jgi:hypothetical protein